MSRVRHFLAAGPSLALAALFSMPLGLLTACGGGGGEAAADAMTPPAPTTPPTTVPVLSGGVAITASNSRVVAADALDAATSTGAAETGSSFVTGVEVAADLAQPLALRLADVGRKFLSMAPAGRALASGVGIRETVQCSGGGSMAMTGNVSDAAAMRAGDTVTLTATNCREAVNGMPMQMAGTMTIAIQGGSYDAASQVYPKHLVMSMNATNFRLVEGGVTTVTNGDLTMDLTEMSPRAASVVVTGTSLSTSVTRPTGTRSFVMRNYRQALAIDGGATSFAATASIETTNTRLGPGTFRYDLSTPMPLTTGAAGDFTGGTLKVTGSASGLLMAVGGTNSFMLQVDADGDGSYEASNPVTFAELQAQL